MRIMKESLDRKGISFKNSCRPIVTPCLWQSHKTMDMHNSSVLPGVSLPVQCILKVAVIANSYCSAFSTH